MFKKKETLLQNMAFMGIIAAINVILCALSTLFPIAGIFIMILLPFFSAMVTMLCKWKYYPIYFFASIGVALAATFWNTEFTLFYLLPSLITGFLFGLCFIKKISGTYALLFTSIVQCGLIYLLLPIIKLIYGTDLITLFLTLFKLNNHENIMIIVPSFIYLLSLIEMVLSYIVLTNEIKKFTQDIIDENDRLIKFISLGLAILVIPFVFFAPNISYLLMFVSLFITISLFIDLVMKRYKLIIVLSSIALAIGFILIFALFNFVKMPYTLLLINTSNIFVSLLALLYNQKEEEKNA